MLHMYQKSQVYDVRFLRYGVRQTEFFVILDHFLPFSPSLLTNYAHLNQGSANLIDMCVTYWPRIVGT